MRLRVEPAHDCGYGGRALDVGVIDVELSSEDLSRFFRGFSLGLELSRALLQIAEHFTLAGNERRIAELAVIGENDARPEGFEFVENREPIGGAHGAFAHAGVGLVLQKIPGKQHSVFRHKRDNIAVRDGAMVAGRLF